jgi:hypothetical protein
VELSHEVLPFGANFAVRTNEQRRYLYDPQLGVRPDSVIGGEETTVIKCMLADGMKGRWVPDARVRHYIPSARQTIPYLRKYFRGYGEYCALQDASSSEPAMLGAPRWLWREAISKETRYRFHRFFSQPEVWIEDLIASSQAWGQLQVFRSKRTAVDSNQRVEEVKNEMI